MKRFKQKMKYGVAVLAATALPSVAMANTDNLGTQITQAMSGFVTVISAIGMAGVSVVVTIVSFALGFSMIKKVSGR